MEVNIKKFKLGVVGPGIIWEKAHKPVLNKLSDRFEVTAFSASSEKSREKVLSEYPGLPFFKDYNELVRSDQIDAVLVLTPINLNAAVSTEALKAGKDVITEKPVASSSLQAKDLIKMEKKTGKKVIILEQFVYKKSAALIRDIISSGKIGEPIFYERILHVSLEQKKGEELSYGNTGWRIKPEFMLGIFFDAGVHDLAELAMIFGDPVSVFASGSKYREGYGPYDHLVVLFKYKDNLNGIFSFSSFLGGSRNRFDVWGTGGQVYDENSIVCAEYGSGEKERFEIDQEDTHMDMWLEIYEYLIGNRNPYYTTSVARNDIKIIEAVDISLKKACRVNV